MNVFKAPGKLFGNTQEVADKRYVTSWNTIFKLAIVSD